MVVFHACYWKKEVTVCSKPRIHWELDFWGPFACLSSSLSDLTLSGMLCSPEPLPALPGSGICQSLGRRELKREIFPVAKHGPYLGRLLVPTSEELLVFLLLGDAPASLGVKEEREGCPRLSAR